MFASLINYLKGARVEFRKVSWPTRDKTVRSTIAVILMSLGMAAFLGGLDYLFSFVSRTFLL